MKRKQEGKNNITKTRSKNKRTNPKLSYQITI